MRTTHPNLTPEDFDGLRKIQAANKTCGTPKSAELLSYSL